MENDNIVDQALVEVLAGDVQGEQQQASTIQPGPGQVELVLRPVGELSTCYYRGFKYTKAWSSRRKVVYRCSRYRSKKCKGKMQFLIATMGYVTAGSHSCRDDETHAPHADLRAQIKETVDNLALADLSLSASSIWGRIQQLFYGERNEYVVQGLTEQQVINRVFRMRRKNFGGDVHGMIEVPPMSLVTGTTMSFFQFHVVTPNQDASKPPNRIIGWAHPKLINLLRYPGVCLFIDGTFRCVPRKFAQCAVIMVHDHASGVYVPVFYILMTSRTADAYFDAIHQVLIATDQQLNPAEVICDFETALIDSIGEHFPNSEIIGCLFHFKQALLRRMKRLTIPKKEIEIAMGHRMLDMLTVIDPEHIESHGCHWVRQQIKAKCDKLGIAYSRRKWKAFWAYFGRTWITKIKPHLWNVHGLDNQLVARTNNPLERFNRELNSKFPTPKPTLRVFVAKIKKVSQAYADRIENVAQGRSRRVQREKIALPRPVNFNGPPSESSESEHDEDEAASGDESDGTDAASVVIDSDTAGDGDDDDGPDQSFDYEGSDGWVSDESGAEGEDHDMIV